MQTSKRHLQNFEIFVKMNHDKKFTVPRTTIYGIM